MLLKGPAQQLADLMIKLSLKYHGKEWEFGLEFELWKEVTEDQDLLSDEEVNKLADTSKWCKGWISMAYKDGKENLEYLLIDDWEEKYRKESPF